MTATDTTAAKPARKRYRRQKYSAEPIAKVPPPEEWGPALAALTDLQRKFVLELHASPKGYGSGVRAAKAAGYAPSDGSLRAEAARTLANPKVQSALRELGPKAISAEGFASIANIAEIANDPKVKPETRLKANIALLSHAFPAQTEHKVVVERTAPDVVVVTEQILTRIATLAARVGLDPDAQVAATRMIDVTPVEVKTDEQRLAD
jgi:hypothetical protein